MVGDGHNIPLMQEIDIAKDDEGQMTIVSERDHFDVVVSDNLYYGLELKYYDQNGMLINHQFSGYPFKRSKEGYPIPDEDNATLLVHQHFFGIGNSSLNQAFTAGGKTETRKATYLAYPRTLGDQPLYYDRYTFRDKGGKAELASKFSTSNIFAPENYTLGGNLVPYSQELAWRSIEVSGKPEYATDSYSDDFVDPDTDAPRQRYGETVGFLRQSRSLDVGTPRDRLGFKGVMQFRKANLAFQLQVRICHIQNKVSRIVGETEKPAKYGNVANSNEGYLWDFNQLQPGWDSFDIDYPLPIRVIADAKDGAEKCYESVKRYYPQVDKTKLWQLLSSPGSYLQQYRHNVVLM